MTNLNKKNERGEGEREREGNVNDRELNCQQKIDRRRKKGRRCMIDVIKERKDNI